MLDQNQFTKTLTKLLTPLPFRVNNEEGDSSKVDTSAWWNTPAITAAAAISSSTHGTEVCHAEWGTRKIPEGPCPDSETLFQAASISKPFQSLAVLHYVSEGVISSLDDAVKNYLSEATYRTLLENSLRKGMPEKLAAQLLDKTTITQLLSHTAGTVVWAYPGYPSPTTRLPSTTEILEGRLGITNTPATYVHTVPGLELRYSGGGSTIIQAMLENIASKHDGSLSFADIMKTKVLEPLGMKRSFYCGGVALPPDEKNYATAYQNGGNSIDLGEYHIYPEQGAAGLWTTSTDLAIGITGFANAILGTESAIKIGGKPWIRPEVAQEIFNRRPELGHGSDRYYCGFDVQFFDDKDGLSRDTKLVRLSHGGTNNGYMCWTAAVFPLPSKLEEVRKEGDIRINAQAVMTNSNYGVDPVGPLLYAFSEILDSTFIGKSTKVFPCGVPFIALDPSPSTPTAGWQAYEGEWELQDRTQTLRLEVNPEPVVVFSHLDDITLPLWATATRKDPELLILRLGSLSTVLEFRWKKDENEVSLTLVTGSLEIKCIKKLST